MSEKKGLSFEDRLDVYKQHVGTKYNRETVSRKLGLPKGCITSYTSASVDNIRHYADGIGDLNPRFRDSEYAKTTKYGRLVAPPLFLMGVCFPFEGMMSVPDARAFHSGSEWEFFQPVLEGDKLDFNGIAVASVEARDSRFSGQMLVSTHICEIRNQRGEVVSLAKGIVHRSFSDEVAVSMGKYKDYKPYRYSEEELRKIDEDYDKEVMRGSRPRYWEDVVEGRLIPHVVNGPRTIMDTISWVVGCPLRSYTQGGRLYRMMVRGGRYKAVYDPVTNTRCHLELPHLNDEFAKRVGVPFAYDLGIERECIAATLFDNWMGDDGFLWKFSIQFRGFIFSGDTIWYKGKVVRKYVDEAKYCVDLEFWGDNQRGERTTMGRAAIILPSKANGQVKYPSPRSLADVFPETD